MAELETQRHGVGARPTPEGPARARAFVLLAGGVRPNSLSARLGRSILELPLNASLRLIDVWGLRLREYLGEAGPGPVPPDVRLLVGRDTPMLAVEGRAGGPRFRTQPDVLGFRGTAGVLRDLCEQFADDDHLLVGNASQCPDEGEIGRLVGAADPADGIALGAAPDGAPSGLMLVRCGALRGIPPVGYIDLKEQALPRIAREAGVRVLQTEGGVSPPIRDLRCYLDALRSWYRSGSLRGVSALNPYEERWKPTFAVVEEGARVGAGARLHDSVVLAGGVVAPNCDVVRSVVGPGGVVRRRERVLERLVLAGEAPTGPAWWRGRGGRR